MKKENKKVDNEVPEWSSWLSVRSVFLVVVTRVVLTGLSVFSEFEGMHFLRLLLPP